MAEPTATGSLASRRSYVRPTVSIEELSHDDEVEDEISEVSPEPSPLPPPEPKQPPSATKNHAPHLSAASIRRRQASSPGQPPLQSDHAYFYSKYRGDDKDGESVEELSALLEAPSPRSPTPGSLFSGAEDGEPTRRSSSLSQRPMREVRLQLSSSRTKNPRHPLDTSYDGNRDEDDISSTGDASTALHQRSTTSSLSGARKIQQHANLLPSLLQLKQDLQKSHQSLFLLQEEHKARCQQFQNEKQLWKSEQDKLIARVREETEEKVMKDYGQVVSDLKKKSELVQQKNQFLDEQVIAIQNELEQTNAALEEQMHENEKLSSELDQADAGMEEKMKELQMLNGELAKKNADTKKHLEENQSLKAELVQRNTALEEQGRLNRNLKKELDEANAALQKSTQERQHIRSDLEKANAALQKITQERQNLRADLEEANAALQKSTQERQNLTAELDQTNASLRERTQERQNLRAELEEANAALQERTQERQKLRAELEEANAALHRSTQEHQKLRAKLEEANATLHRSMQERQKLRAELEESNAALHRSTQERQKLRAELDQTNAALQKSTQECEEANVVLRERTQECQNLRVELDQANASLELQLDENESLKLELDETNAALGEHVDENEMLNTEIKQAREALVQTQEKCESLRQREEDMRRRHERELTSATSSLRAEVEYWKRELSMSHEQFRNKLSEISHAGNARVDEQAAALEKAHKVIAELRAQKLALRQELMEFKIRRQPRLVGTDCQTGDSLLVGDDEIDDDVFGTTPNSEKKNDSDVSRVSPIAEGEDVPSLLESSATSIPEDSGILEAEEDVNSMSSNSEVSEGNNSDTGFQKELDELREKHENELRCLIRAHQRQEEQHLSSDVAAPSQKQKSPPASKDELRRHYEEQMRELEQNHLRHMQEMKEQLTREVAHAALQAVVTSLGERNHPNSSNSSPQHVDRQSLSTQNTETPTSQNTSPGMDSQALLASLKEELTRSVTKEALKAVEEAVTTANKSSQTSPLQQPSPQESLVPSQGEHGPFQSPLLQQPSPRERVNQVHVQKVIFQKSSRQPSPQGNGNQPTAQNTPFQSPLQQLSTQELVNHAQGINMPSCCPSQQPSPQESVTVVQGQGASPDTQAVANSADVESQMKKERQAKRQELLTLQREWQEETNALLDSIQRECNEVFERSRTDRARTSPRTVALPDLSMYDDDGEGYYDDIEQEESDEQLIEQVSSSSSNGGGSPESDPAAFFANFASPGMDLDRTLDETEALVRSLLGGH